MVERHVWQTGDKVMLKCGKKTVPATVLSASANGVSLMVKFDAMLEGHVGKMPILRDRKGVYHSIMTQTEVILSPIITGESNA